MKQLHQTQEISVSFVDGSISILYFILDPNLPEGTVLAGYDPKTGLREASDEAIGAEVTKAFDGKAVHWRKISKQDLMHLHRVFRPAWRDDGQAIVHDMDHCRLIHKNALRELRAPKFAALDVEYQRADESSDAASNKRDIAARKQRLRDITADPRIGSAATPEELLKVTID